MSAAQLYIVRRCDGFYRFWHDVSEPTSMPQSAAIYSRLTRGGTQSTTPHDVEYYEIFAADPLPGWQDGPPPLIRRLHRQDAQAVAAHLLGLDYQDRNLRFFRQVTDTQIQAYVQGIDWDHSLLLGAIKADHVVGLAEALFNRSGPPRHAEVAVSVNADLRGRGLGGVLVTNVVGRSRLLGVTHASLSFLRENRPIQRIVRTLGGRVDMEDLVGEISMDAAADSFDQRIAA